MQPLIVLLVCVLSITDRIQCNHECTGNTCFSDEPSVSNTIDDHVLVGHVLQNITVESGTSCSFYCMLDCRCLSFHEEKSGNLCTLNYESNWTMPGSLRNLVGFRYVNFEMKIENECPGQQCENFCCLNNPCRNGGKCNQICTDKTNRFKCACPSGYTGSLCQIKLSSYKSCKEIKKVLGGGSFAVTGVYNISDGKTMSQVRCLMEEIPGCGSGPWTLVMKMNGKERTFEYDSDLWSDKILHNIPKGLEDDLAEVKVASYWITPFTKLCLGMKEFNKKTKWLQLPHTSSSLYDVIAAGNYVETFKGYDFWAKLMSDPSLQMRVTREGFNAMLSSNSHSRVRIGIIGNDDNNMYSPNSRIGFGGQGSFCESNPTFPVSCGNAAGCSPNNGPRETPAWGFIYVQ